MASTTDNPYDPWTNSSYFAYSDVLDKQTADNLRCRLSIQRDPATTKSVGVVKNLFENQSSGITVATPSMRFIRAGHYVGQLKIQQDGLTVTTVGLSGKISFTFGALTDGLLEDGRFYWEIGVPSGTSGKWVCVLGVGNKDSLEEPTRKYKYVTYAIPLKCNKNKYKWCLYSKDPADKPREKWKACRRIDRVGIYLDTYSKIMIFIDCSRNQVFATIIELNVSSPFVPAVNILTSSNGVSVHLISQPDLPQVLCDKLRELAARHLVVNVI